MCEIESTCDKIRIFGISKACFSMDAYTDLVQRDKRAEKRRGAKSSQQAFRELYPWPISHTILTHFNRLSNRMIYIYIISIVLYIYISLRVNEFGKVEHHARHDMERHIERQGAPTSMNKGTKSTRRARRGFVMDQRTRDALPHR
jgi:hypothetical protein